MYPLVRGLASDGVPVTATCRVLKITHQPSYQWLPKRRQSLRPTPNIYPEVGKAKIIRRLEERTNVSAIARELGFTRITCSSGRTRRRSSPAGPAE